mgnify:CR=1 FL=1
MKKITKKEMKTMKGLETELNKISKLVKMQLVTCFQLETMLKTLSEKYDTAIVWRNKIVETNELVVKFIY